MRMREAMREINEARGGEDLALDIGLHAGPCLAVVLDDHQDYFGQTVNIASRVQGLADPTAILATKPVIESTEVARLLTDASYRTTPRSSMLRGVSEAFESRGSRTGGPGSGGVKVGERTLAPAALPNGESGNRPPSPAHSPMSCRRAPRSPPRRA